MFKGNNVALIPTHSFSSVSKSPSISLIKSPKLKLGENSPLELKTP